MRLLRTASVLKPEGVGNRRLQCRQYLGDAEFTFNWKFDQCCVDVDWIDQIEMIFLELAGIALTSRIIGAESTIVPSEFDAFDFFVVPDELLFKIDCRKNE